MISGFVKCCRNFLDAAEKKHAVLCLEWLLSIRIIILGSLFIHILWRYYHPPQFYSIVLIVFHSVIAILILRECKKSEHYHRTMKKLEKSAKKYQGGDST